MGWAVLLGPTGLRVNEPHSRPPKCPEVLAFPPEPPPGAPPPAPPSLTSQPHSGPVACPLCPVPVTLAQLRPPPHPAGLSPASPRQPSYRQFPLQTYCPLLTGLLRLPSAPGHMVRPRPPLQPLLPSALQTHPLPNQPSLPRRTPLPPVVLHSPRKPDPSRTAGSCCQALQGDSS